MNMVSFLYLQLINCIYISSSKYLVYSVLLPNELAAFFSKTATLCLNQSLTTSCQDYSVKPHHDAAINL